MNSEVEKSSSQVIEYVETMIMAGKLKVDDRLPPERDLAKMLDVSRTSVREGIRLLEVSGIVESRQGSGNYITRQFDRSLEKILTIMYALDELNYTQVREFRYAVERQALTLAVGHASEEDRVFLRQCLDGLIHGETEEMQTDSDRQLHLRLVQMSGNRLVISNYLALNRIIDRSIRDVRRKIRDESPEIFADFEAAHQDLVDAVIAGNLELAKDALDRHFAYITQDIDT